MTTDFVIVTRQTLRSLEYNKVSSCWPTFNLFFPKSTTHHRGFRYSTTISITCERSLQIRTSRRTVVPDTEMSTLALAVTFKGVLFAPRIVFVTGLTCVSFVPTRASKSSCIMVTAAPVSNKVFT